MAIPVSKSEPSAIAMARAMGRTGRERVVVKRGYVRLSTASGDF